MKKSLAGYIAVIVLALSAGAWALPAQAQLALGRDYVVIDPPQPTADPAKIEVIEFFSYACPHCHDLNPHILKWAAALPADVAFTRLAVGFNDRFYQLMARLYFALEASGELGRLDGAVFDAIHNRGLKLIDEKSIIEWVSGKGVDAKKFSDAFRSFTVDSKTKRADQMAQLSKITGVPAIVVDGRYLVTGKDVKSHGDLLALANKVIEKRRAERTPGGAGGGKKK